MKIDPSHDRSPKPGSEGREKETQNVAGALFAPSLTDNRVIDGGMSSEKTVFLALAPPAGFIRRGCPERHCIAPRRAASEWRPRETHLATRPNAARRTHYREHKHPQRDRYCVRACARVFSGTSNSSIEVERPQVEE
ncbi:Protein of unknown function [Gryllus bimaculatus]|nr:Protein of unknown function [Gryllus bimaculatus]